MSTQPLKTNFQKALGGVPANFRKRILDTYHEIKKREREASLSESFDAAGISTGKFCESVIRLLQHELTGSSTQFGKHIPNFPDACRKLITSQANSGPESLRIVIPRALVFLYTMRGKRGIGHVGGDIEANSIDLATMVRVCDWILCELVRVYHTLPIEDAQAVVDALAIKQLPEIWEVAGKKRVLNTGLRYKEKVLLLLYSGTDSNALPEELFDWCEHSHFSNFQRDVLNKLHGDKLIEYDRSEQIVYLSPKGVVEVETDILFKASF